MPTTNYIHANGVKISQIKDGVRTDFLTDALGSVTATKNQSQQIVNTYRYKPYGKLLARTGSGEDPRYLWTGNTGSRVTQTRNVNQYNVARHYANGPASWTSVDDYWPQEMAYGYCKMNPAMMIDPSGNWCYSIVGALPGSRDAGLLNGLVPPEGSKVLDRLINCLKKKTLNCEYPQDLSNKELGSGLEQIRDTGCGGEDERRFELMIMDPGYWPFSNPCNNSSVCGFTNMLRRPPRIHICRRAWTDNKCGGPLCVFIHELIHAVGKTHNIHTDPVIAECFDEAQPPYCSGQFANQH